MAHRPFSLHAIVFAALVAFSVALTACGDEEGPDAAVPGDAAVSSDASPQQDGSTTGDAAVTGDGGADGGEVDAADGPRSIVFLHTNDEHSHVLGFAPEIDDFPTAAPPGSGIVGGLKRRANLIQQLKAEAALLPSPVALVSAGDEMMGSLFHIANPARGVDYVIATILGYDAMTLGNHEFDFGPGALAAALSTGGGVLQPGIVSIPVVVSNIRFSMTSTVDDGLGSALLANRERHPAPSPHLHPGLRGCPGWLHRAPRLRGRAGRAIQTTGALLDGDDLDAHLQLERRLRGRLGVSTARRVPDGDHRDLHRRHRREQHHPLQRAGRRRRRRCGRVPTKNVDLVVALSHVGVNERELSALEMMGMGPESLARLGGDLLAQGVDRAWRQEGHRCHHRRPQPHRARGTADYPQPHGT